MDFQTFILTFKTTLEKNPLPGTEAQLLMASEFYKNKRVDLSRLSGHKESAVCLLFYEKNRAIYFLLIRRPGSHRHHAGQIALPGGRCEAGESYEQTALRELYEETGIQIPPQNIVGRLSPLYIPVSNFYIQPIVAFSEKIPKHQLSGEVEEVIECSLQSLLDEKILGETEVVTAGNIKLKTPYFNVQGHVLWGATAMLLSEVKQILLAQRATFSFLFQ